MSERDGRILTSRSEASRTTWQPIGTAPRDGSIIEIECRWGVKPYRNLYRWRPDKYQMDATQRFNFWKLDSACESSIMEEALCTCRWRPFDGDPALHWDPYEEIDSFDYHCGKRPSSDGPFMPLPEPDAPALKAAPTVAPTAYLANSRPWWKFWPVKESNGSSLKNSTEGMVE